jgi:SAM-dependent methyltransferase
MTSSVTRFDIVMVCDFRPLGGTSTALATEIKIFHDVGLKIGLVQVNSHHFGMEVPIHPAILDCVSSGSARWVRPEQSTECELLALHNPVFFGRTKFPQHDIRSRNRIVVAHHVPLGPTGALNYDPWRLQAALRRSFGGEFIWAPVSPVCRDQFRKIAFQLPLLAEDWHNVIRVEEWGAPRSSPKFSNCVIGRHSRPQPDKWPATKSEILQCYPAEPDFEVRILGADSYLKQLIGQIPKNWRLFVFNEIAPKEFLQSIDFFVYFHHPLTIEAFGRAPAEAAAAGCVLILPPYLRDTFGDGAIYCEPRDVATVVRKYRSDSEAYRLQSKRGHDVVREHFGPESLLRLAKSSMVKPNVVIGKSSGDGWPPRDTLWRFALRAKLRVPEMLSAAKRLIRRILRILVPKPLRSWLQQIMLDRRISRSPDRAILLKNVFPAFHRTSSASRGTKVLWIGCRRYTKKYYALLEAQRAECWSMDLEPDVKRWGRRGRHITDNVLKLAERFPSREFDAIFLNGIFGWGVDTPEDQRTAFEVMAKVIKSGGWLLVGWNTDRIEDPLPAGLAAPWFEHVPMPGFSARYVVDGCTHVYDTYRRTDYA